MIILSYIIFVYYHICTFIFTNDDYINAIISNRRVIHTMLHVYIHYMVYSQLNY